MHHPHLTGADSPPPSGQRQAGNLALPARGWGPIPNPNPSRPPRWVFMRKTENHSHRECGREGCGAVFVVPTRAPRKRFCSAVLLNSVPAQRREGPLPGTPPRRGDVPWLWPHVLLDPPSTDGYRCTAAWSASTAPAASTTGPGRTSLARTRGLPGGNQGYPPHRKPARPPGWVARLVYGSHLFVRPSLDSSASRRLSPRAGYCGSAMGEQPRGRSGGCLGGWFGAGRATAGPGPRSGGRPVVGEERTFDRVRPAARVSRRRAALRGA